MAELRYSSRKERKPMKGEESVKQDTVSGGVVLEEVEM